MEQFLIYAPISIIFAFGLYYLAEKNPRLYYPVFILLILSFAAIYYKMFGGDWIWGIPAAAFLVSLYFLLKAIFTFQQKKKIIFFISLGLFSAISVSGIFFKNKKPVTVPLMVQNFENDQNQYYITDKNHSSGNFSAEMNPNCIFAGNYECACDSNFIAGNKTIRYSASFLVNDKKTAGAVNMIVTMIHDTILYQYRGMRIDSAENFTEGKWCDISMDYKIPNFAAGDRLKCYIMYTDKPSVFIDDVKVELVNQD